MKIISPAELGTWAKDDARFGAESLWRLDFRSWDEWRAAIPRLQPHQVDAVAASIARQEVTVPPDVCAIMLRSIPPLTAEVTVILGVLPRVATMTLELRSQLNTLIRNQQDRAAVQFMSIMIIEAMHRLIERIQSAYPHR